MVVTTTKVFCLTINLKKQFFENGLSGQIVEIYYQNNLRIV